MPLGAGITSAIGEVAKVFNSFLDPEKRAKRKQQQLLEQDRKISEEINEIIINKQDTTHWKRLSNLLLLRNKVRKTLKNYQV